jgi:diguanylate cyclase (GGDEF)-like protein
VQEQLLSFICEKNGVSYILFDKDFHIKDSFEIDAKKESSVQDVLWELVGFEEEILADKKVAIPMVMREGLYYDLFIEPFYEKEQKLFIAYMQKKSKETEAYANVLKEINKKTLIFDTSDEKKESRSYQEINKRLLTLHVDAQGKISKVNDAVTYFFNCEKASMIGVHFSKFFTPQSSKNKNKSSIFVAKNSFDKEIFFHADVIPLSDKKGNVIENIIIAQDISYLKEIEKELEYAQEHDTLTGLPNRHAILRMIDTKEDATIALLDIDSFATINEEYGAHAADMLLKHIVSLIEALLEPGDVLARLFGDSFIILFEEGKTKEYINVLLKKIAQTIQNNPLYYTHEDIITAKITTALASMQSDIDSAQDLLQSAQKALKREKLLKKAALS